MPTATPEWFTLISPHLHLGSAAYADGNIGYIRLSSLTCITTELAKLCVQYDVVGIRGELVYSAAYQFPFTMKGRVTAPDGVVTESSHEEKPYHAYNTGVDSYEVSIDTTVEQVFEKMIDESGEIQTGLYLYELFVDDELMGSFNFNVVDSDTSPGYVDHETLLYAAADCAEEIGVLKAGDDVVIDDLTESGKNGYVFHVRFGEQEGYLQCYDVLPNVDNSVLTFAALQEMDGVSVNSAYTKLALGSYGESFGLDCLTLGLAKYCVAKDAASITTHTTYIMTRPFIPQGLGEAQVEVVSPEGKKTTLTLEDAAAKAVVDSSKMIFDMMGDKKRTNGEYTVTISYDGEPYASYMASWWGDDRPYLHDGFTRSWDAHFYTRIICPDASVYQTEEENPTWSNFAYVAEEENRNTYEDHAIMDVFQNMVAEGGIQAGRYILEIYLDNKLVFSDEFEVLDDERIPVKILESTKLYADPGCTEELSSVSGGSIALLLEDAPISFETQSRYGDWQETHLAFPVKYREQTGYFDGIDISPITSDDLADYLEKLLTQKERKDWISLAFDAGSTCSSTAYSRATGQVMTSGMASLVAENEAYDMCGVIVYSLREDRPATFVTTITKPDGSVFEYTQEDIPSYNLEDTATFLDESPCAMFKEQKEAGGILPGSYHYEITEANSGLYMDGWFDVIDVDLALGRAYEDAALYDSINRSHRIATVPIHSDIFLYEEYRKIDDWNYFGRISWNGVSGYVDIDDVSTEPYMDERLGKIIMSQEIVPVTACEIILQAPGEETEQTMTAPLTLEQAQSMVDEEGAGGIHVEMMYEPPQEEAILSFKFVLEAPSGTQIATNDLYVYVVPDSGVEPKLVDGVTIDTLLSRMYEQGNIETGVYHYSVQMNGQKIAETQFEIVEE